MNKITEEKSDAYFAAGYRIFTQAGEMLLPACGETTVQRAALITAYNPFGQQCLPELNQSNQAQLIADVESQWNYLPAEGYDPSGQWPAEPSLLVLGISLDDALELGRKYKQHAILYVDGAGHTNLYDCDGSGATLKEHIFPERQPLKMKARAEKLAMNLEEIRTELDWVLNQKLKDHEFQAVCQCGTEKLIQRSSDPQRMRASMLALVFVDQFVFTHHRGLHTKFRDEFPIPKLVAHVNGSSNCSPSWFVYSNHGFDKKADWQLISKTFTACIHHLYRWLTRELGESVPGLQAWVEEEVSNEFDPDHHKYFSVLIGDWDLTTKRRR